jgi:hypothetical protein
VAIAGKRFLRSARKGIRGNGVSNARKSGNASCGPHKGGGLVRRQLEKTAFTATGFAVVIAVFLLLSPSKKLGDFFQSQAIASIYSTNQTYSLSSGALTMATCMLDNVTCVAPGDWIDVHAFRDKSIHVMGVTTATLQIRISNSPIEPAMTDDGIQLGANITANGVHATTTPCRWMKVMVSAYTSGTIKVFFFGQGM